MTSEQHQTEEIKDQQPQQSEKPASPPIKKEEQSKVKNDSSQSSEN